MVRLRLRRKGRIHHPVYDIIAIDGRARRDGAYLERLGFYDPNTHPNTITIQPERAIYWLNVGAQPSDVVERILSYEGVLLRRHLEFKGKSAEEIEAEVAKHKEVVTRRYDRRKKLRKERQIEKAKAEAAAKAAEEAAKNAPAEG
ncbi:MAG: 30S ribosomal protein S16 [Chloroflexota bacterium]